MEKEIGKVTHFFQKISVAIVELKDELKTGDEILIKDGGREIKQKVESMQIEHKDVAVATKGQSIGLKVTERVREGNTVFKVME